MKQLNVCLIRQALLSLSGFGVTVASLKFLYVASRYRLIIMRFNTIECDVIDLNVCTFLFYQQIRFCLLFKKTQ